MAYKFIQANLICSVTRVIRYDGRKEVYWLNKKWLFALFVILAITVMFFFFKWLYTPDTYTNAHRSDMGPSDSNSTDAVEVFNYDIEKRLKLEEYSNNPSIQLINTVITSAKVSYERDYGCPMPGLFASTASGMTDGLHTDISNPITYLNIAFTAFSQYDPSTFAYAGNNGAEPAGNTSPPNVTNFEDAPEGAIYFSEEDEYNSEGQVPAQQPLTPAGTQVTQIVEETVGLPGKIAVNKKAPQVLIYHSHSMESYMPSTEGNYHTLNEKYSVIAAGNALAKELQDRYKYKVIHDKSKHDRESYAYSYANSLVTVKNNINKYSSLKVILDLHRDAFDVRTEAEKKAKKAEYTATVNKKSVARIMLVIAKGNPNYAELEKFAVYLKKKMDKLYPGLSLKIDVKSRGKYNQYFSNHSMLVEIGCMLNTTEEAQYSAQLFGKVLGEVMKDLEE
ncbi:MAG: stage II sporulation protein P [Clostridia bacterium]